MALYHSTKGPVDYTVVGTPTIVDGVVSNFSSGELTSEQVFSPGSSTWEIGFDFTTGSFTRAQGVITGVGTTNSIAPLFIQNDGRMSFFASSVGGSSWDLANQFNIGHIAANTHYFIKEKYTGREYTIDVWINGVQQTQKVLSKNTPIIGGLKLLFGNNRNTGAADYFRGSINLNSTYIIIDGQPWFGLCPIEVKKHQLRGPVGYTVVGSPTITDGVVSGFSNSNYLTTPEFSPGNNPWEIVCRFSTKDLNEAGGIITGLGSSDSIAPFYINQYNTNKIIAYLSSNGSSWNLANAIDILTVESNTTYKLKAEFTGTSYNWYKWENNVWVLLQTVNSSTPIYGTIPLVIGNNRGNNFPFNGSIDLNETYIKVNGKLWFYQPAPTKYIVKDDKLVFADQGLYLTGPVNYETVGSPTIVDGVASGFSGNNHLTIDTLIPFETADTWEIGTAFVAKDSDDWQSLLAFETGLNDGVAIDIHPTNNRLYVKTDNGQLFLSNSLVITYDIRYYVKLKFTGTTYIFSYSLDNSTWIDYATLESSTKTTNSVVQKQSIGYSSRYSGREWLGSIDLKKTYIKVNDQLWFYGKNYATQNIAPVPAGYTYGTTTTSAIGWVDMRTQAFTAAPSGATIGRDV